MASYSQAIEWIADNDDTDFLDHEDDVACGTLSVTASMVCDLFDKTEEQVKASLRLRLRRKMARE